MLMPQAFFDVTKTAPFVERLFVMKRVLLLFYFVFFADG